MSDRQKRLNEVYEHLHNYFGVHTKGEFADIIKYARAYVSSALNGNEKYLTDKLFTNICEAYPGVFNLKYLLTGTGSLLTIREEVTKEELKVNPPQPTSYVDKLIASLEKQIKDKDDQLADKDRIIKLLEQKIEVLEAMQHIDSSDPLKYYPFTPGVADKGDQKSTRV